MKSVIPLKNYILQAEFLPYYEFTHSPWIIVFLSLGLFQNWKKHSTFKHICARIRLTGSDPPEKRYSTCRLLQPPRFFTHMCWSNLSKYFTLVPMIWNQVFRLTPGPGLANCKTRVRFQAFYKTGSGSDSNTLTSNTKQNSTPMG